MDELIDADFGKHDYDWLLTPPETPLVPSSGEKDHQITPATSRGRSARSASTARASGASASQLHNGHSTKPVRSSSITRPSILNTHSSISIKKSASILNTSIASVTSRSSTPVSRSNTLRPSLTSRPVPARFQAPAKLRQAPTSSGVKTTKSHNSRPQIPSNPNPNPTVTSSSPRLHSRSSTPTRKPINPLPTPISGQTTSVGRTQNPSAAAVQPSSPSPWARAPVHPMDILDFTNDAPPKLRTKLHERAVSVGRAINPLLTPISGQTTSVGRTHNPSAAAVQPSSPSPRARAPVHPMDILDFTNDAPPNLRTKLHERAVSVGRVRPGAALKAHSNLNSQNVVSPSLKHRHPLPVVSNCKFPPNSPKAQLKSYGHQAAPSQTQKSVVADGGARRTNKAGGATESTGFGRNISKMSLDMALRHMDIKQSIGGIRGTSLTPHSIRSNSRPKRISEPLVPVKTDEVVGSAIASADCNRSASHFSPQQNSLISRKSNTDPHGSSRYDALLLKEDSCNLNWLHNIEDKPGQPPEFDHGFERLPEPFGPL